MLSTRSRLTSVFQTIQAARCFTFNNIHLGAASFQQKSDSLSNLSINYQSKKRLLERMLIVHTLVHTAAHPIRSNVHHIPIITNHSQPLCNNEANTHDTSLMEYKTHIGLLQRIRPIKTNERPYNHSPLIV